MEVSQFCGTTFVGRDICWIIIAVLTILFIYLFINLFFCKLYLHDTNIDKEG